MFQQVQQGFLMTDNSTKKRNRLRIIGGDWRSRVLDFPDAPGLRPTPDRIRETLFNWLQLKIAGANCLDLFSGSGALGFEALSRGASMVTSLETDNGAVKAIENNACQLGTTAMKVQRQDAMAWLNRQNEARPFDLVFIDPPFASVLQAQCCSLLAANGWLSAGALVYVEAAEPVETLPLPAGWTLLKHKRAGDVHYGLCQASL